VSVDTEAGQPLAKMRLQVCCQPRPLDVFEEAAVDALIIVIDMP
jgi:hypothetical protein